MNKFKLGEIVIDSAGCHCKVNEIIGYMGTDILYKVYCKEHHGIDIRKEKELQVYLEQEIRSGITLGMIKEVAKEAASYLLNTKKKS